MFVSVGNERIVSESPEFVMICAAVPWRWSGIVGTMMTLGDFDVRVVGRGGIIGHFSVYY